MVRRARTKSEKQDVVTLGMATGQTGWYDSQNVLDHGHDQAWALAVPDPLRMQFEHLPQTADGVPLDVPFFGLPQKNSTDNLCFVDMHWADLLSSSYTEAGMPSVGAGRWTGGSKVSSEEWRKRTGLQRTIVLRDLYSTFSTRYRRRLISFTVSCE